MPSQVATRKDVAAAVPAVSLSGTEAQVEWAERIRRQVSAEFDRVAASFRSVAAKQGAGKRADTETVIAIQRNGLQ